MGMAILCGRAGVGGAFHSLPGSRGVSGHGRGGTAAGLI